jgi:REP element-mobilizing transposase RayT
MDFMNPSRDRKGVELENPSLTVGARNLGEARNARPLAYHIVFSCYGARLHGDEAGSVDRDHNLPGTEYLPSNPQRAQSDFDRMAEPAYEMDGPRRKVVLEAILEVCIYRHWVLLAAHVRTTHVHAVVKALIVPERILNDFKSYSSRRLNESGFDQAGRKRWSHHGSTRYLWKPQQVQGAIQYVLEAQGEPMEGYLNPNCHVSPSHDRKGVEIGSELGVGMPSRDCEGTVD